MPYQPRKGPRLPPSTGKPAHPMRPVKRAWQPVRPERATARKSQGGDVPAEFADKARGLRLQKALAAAGVASRRECEEMIAAGRVTVNSHKVTALPAWVDPQHDRVELDGQLVRLHKSRTTAHPEKVAPPGSSSAKHLYLLVNKPRGVITTTEDPLGRKNVMDLLPEPLPPGRRLFPVGRLDAESTGLLLLTDDGDLAARLTHPRYGIPKVYEVAVRGRITPEDIDRLKKGIMLTDVRRIDPIADREEFLQQQSRGRGKIRGERDSDSRFTNSAPRTPPPGPKTQDPGPQSVAPMRRAVADAVSLVNYSHDRNGQDRTTLKITLTEGQNREVRRMLAALGFKVRRLRRIAIGPLHIKGIGFGQIRALTETEIRQLKRAAGMDVRPTRGPLRGRRH